MGHTSLQDRALVVVHSTAHRYAQKIHSDQRHLKGQKHCRKLTFGGNVFRAWADKSFQTCFAVKHLSGSWNWPYRSLGNFVVFVTLEAWLWVCFFCRQERLKVLFEASASWNSPSTAFHQESDRKSLKQQKNLLYLQKSHWTKQQICWLGKYSFKVQ